MNPTEVEVHDIINKIDDGSGVLTFEDFCTILQEKNKENDSELHYKVRKINYRQMTQKLNILKFNYYITLCDNLEETFRVFSKDDEGCIPAEELAFVLAHHPRNVSKGVNENSW